MASELLKTKALSARIKEPKVRDFDFGLNLTSVESLIPDLPEPKPPELLDIQEQNRKGRLLDSLNKIGGGLEDSSLDFIRRDNFDKGGVAKVFAHLDSLSEGTEIDLNYIRKYIGDNNINASPENVFKQFDKINLKQIAGSGNETFTYGKEKRDQLTRLKNKLKIKKLTRYIPATKENLDKLDDLIKNTDLTVEQIGEKMGYENPKSFKIAPTTKNVLTKAYLKKYGSPPEGRFKVKILDPESKYVKDAINLKEQGVSTRQIANKLNKTRMAIVNVFRKMGREDLIDDVNEKKTDSAKKTVKKNRMVNIAEGEKFASESDKAFNKKEEARVKEINKYVKEYSDDLANNKKLVNLINLKLDGKGNIISKNKTPEEIKKSINRDRFFERDHISSVAKRKRNMQFPVNFQMSPYNINQGFFTAAEAYVNRPDADPEKIKKISNVLDNYKLRLSTNKGIIGSKEIPASQTIDSNLKALDINPNIGSNIKVKKLIASVSPNKNCQGKFNTGGPVNIDKCFYEGEKAINDLKIKPGGAQYRNFVKLGQVLAKTGKTAAGAADILLSVGAGPKGLAVGVLLETGFAAEQLSKGQPGIAFSQTILGDLYNAVMPDEAEFSVGNRLLKSAKTEEEKVVIQNLIDFDKDQKLFKKKLNRFDYLSSAPDFETEGVNLDALKKELVDLKFDLDNREPKVRSKDSAKILSKVSYRVGEEGRDLLKGVYGKFFGDRQLTDKSMQPPVLAKSFFKAMAPQPSNVSGVPMYEAPGQVESTFDQLNLPTSYEATPEEIDANFDMQGGIMAASGGRIGYSNGSEGTALAIEKSLEAFQRYINAGGKLGYKDFIALGNEGVSKFFNSGGRVGFADGPDNPGRRKFMKLAAGLASIPILGKFFKGAKVASLVKPIPNSSTVMPDWFPNFVDKFIGRSIGKKIDADIMEYTNPDLPNIKLTRNDDGSLVVLGKNEHNESYNIMYEPPGYEVLDYKTGKSVKTPGEFEAVEGRHVALGPDDYDTDPFYAEDLDELFTSDVADMEKYATGNVSKTVKDAFGKETGLKKGKYEIDMAQGQAENRADILRDEGLDEID